MKAIQQSCVELYPTLREALFYQRVRDKLQCKACRRYCLIAPNCTGFCRTRKHVDGKLYTLVYGDVRLHTSANPIEKKPFFHFWPGSFALTVGTWGCNFKCEWCCNRHMTRDPTRPDPERSLKEDAYVSPEELVELCKLQCCQGISVSFNEPTLLLEYSIDVFKLAKKETFELRGKKFALHTSYVTNGYLSSEAIGLLAKHLDAANVDVKGNSEVLRRYCKAEAEPVWQCIEELLQKKVHVELTFLIIPKINDSVRRLQVDFSRVHDLDPNIPVHITAYNPIYELMSGDKPVSYETPVQLLEQIHGLAKSIGLRYAYMGNVPGHPLENTYCPACNELLIKRHNFSVLEYKLKDKACSSCGEKIPIVGEYV